MIQVNGAGIDSRFDTVLAACKAIDNRPITTGVIVTIPGTGHNGFLNLAMRYDFTITNAYYNEWREAMIYAIA